MKIPGGSPPGTDLPLPGVAQDHLAANEALQCTAIGPVCAAGDREAVLLGSKAQLDHGTGSVRAGGASERIADRVGAFAVEFVHRIDRSVWRPDPAAVIDRLAECDAEPAARRRPAIGGEVDTAAMDRMQTIDLRMGVLQLGRDIDAVIRPRRVARLDIECFATSARRLESTSRLQVRVQIDPAIRRIDIEAALRDPRAVRAER